jgi:hypoxanthine phosphoribosyltransferase
MNWEEFDREVRSLAKKIEYAPDVVIGIARGGVIPAVLLARSLKVKDMYALKVRREGDERTVIAETIPDVMGLKILLVEDTIETGRSLIAAKQYLESKGAEVRTACLYTTPISEIEPDYTLREVPKVMLFPWE